MFVEIIHDDYGKTFKFNGITKDAIKNKYKDIDGMNDDRLYVFKYIEANLKPYDILPLIPIIKNAGAIVSNWKNEPAEKGGNIIATSNRKLHNKILKLLKPFT